MRRGVKADGEKVKAMVNWLQSRDVSELRGFFCSTSYYIRFVRSYGDIVVPLTKLLLLQKKKKGFKWSEEATNAFEQLNQAMIYLPPC